MHARGLLVALLVALPCAACGTRESAGPQSVAPTYDASGRAATTIPPAAKRPNVLVLVLDTLRADAVRPEADGATEMPYLSRLAGESVHFTQASSVASWTLPSLASTLTGLPPHRHGLTGDELRGPTLEGVTTWAEVMRSALGYQTAAFFGGLGQGVVQALGEGFERVSDGLELQQAPSQLQRWIDTRRTDQPFFLLLHSFEAHDPYGAANHPVGGARGSARALAALETLGPNPPAAELVRRSVLDAEQRYVLRTDPRMRAFQPEITRYLWSGLTTDPEPLRAQQLAEDLAQAYRQGLTWVDGLVERTLEHLRAQGLLENTLLVVTADHGESFGEHGMLLHGRQLYDELLHVPLLLSGPAPFDRAATVTGSVGLTDLFPSILAWLGAPPPDDVDGTSFLPLLSAPGAGRPVAASEVRSHFHTGGLSVATLASVRSSTWKYIGTFDLTRGTLTEEAYDLRSDPGELHNRADSDGLVRDQPFGEEFCRAVERARDRLWGSAAQADWSVSQGYSANAPTSAAGRPDSDCDAPP